MSETLYLRREFTAAPLGDGTVLAVLPPQGQVIRLESDMARVLAARREPDSLEGHAQHLARELLHPPAARGALLARLAGLAAQGLFVPWPGRPAATERDREPAVLGWLGIPTRDRPEALARCLRSHLGHARAAGRRLDASVIDSSAPDGAAANRTIAAAAAAEFGCQVHLVTAGDRRAFAERLAAAAEVPPELASFALLDAGHGHDTGCNRNALLLGHVGRAFLSSDDDVLATPRAAAGAGARMALTCDANPTEVRLFRDEQAALDAIPPWSGSLLDEHERVLGRSLASLLLAPGASVPWRDLQGDLARLVAEGSGAVRVTATGLVGDAGSRYPCFYLWEASARAQLRPAADEEFRDLVESRQILRAAATATASTGPFLMTTHLALDHRHPLPPFFPAFRGQDLNFGRLLRHACPEALIAHLPCAIQHLPAVPRRASADRLWPAGPGITFATLLEACLALAARGISHVAGEERRLRLLGRNLVELAARAPEELHGLLREQVTGAIAAQVAACRAALEGPDADSAWRRALRAFLRDSLDSLSDLRPLATFELSAAAPGVAEQEAIRLLRRFGRLLECWPDLVAAARALSAAGQGLFAGEGSSHAGH